MYGKCNYDVWVEKYGKNEADRLDTNSRIKNSISNAGIKNGFYGKHHSESTRALLKNKLTQYAKDHPEVSENSRKRIMELISSGKMFKKNQIERATENWFKCNNIRARYNFILDGKYQYDFRFLNTKTIVEDHGDFWHGNPLIYDDSELSERQKFKRQRDIEKLDYATSKGYTILYIWESDVRKNDFSALEGLL